MILDSTTKSIEIVLSGAVTTNQLRYVTSYSDITTTTFTPGASDGVTNNTTPVTIVSAPASSTQRSISHIMINNLDTTSKTITVNYNNNSTLRVIIQVTLQQNETMQYNAGEGWKITTVSGSKKAGGSTYIGSPLMRTPVDVAALTDSFGPSGSAQTLYCFVGTAKKASSSVDVLVEVLQAASGITWAEICICRASILNTTINYNSQAAGASRATVPMEVLGYADVSATYNSLGVKKTTVTLTRDIAAGDLIYVGFGNSASTAFSLLAGGNDDVQFGYQFQSVIRPSTQTNVSDIPSRTPNTKQCLAYLYLN